MLKRRSLIFSIKTYFEAARTLTGGLVIVSRGLAELVIGRKGRGELRGCTRDMIPLLVVDGLDGTSDPGENSERPESVPPGVAGKKFTNSTRKTGGG